MLTLRSRRDWNRCHSKQHTFKVTSQTFSFSLTIKISSSASCSLSGVDGSFVVKNMHGGATVQINKLYPGSESMVVSKHGSVSAHVDPEVTGRMERLG